MDNAGFVLWRKGPGDVAFKRVTESLIPATGSATQGAEYVLIDADADVAGSYSYRLQDIDTQGVSSFHRPVVTCGATK